MNPLVTKAPHFHVTLPREMNLWGDAVLKGKIYEFHSAWHNRDATPKTAESLSGRPSGKFFTGERARNKSESLSLYEFCIAINIYRLPVPPKSCHKKIMIFISEMIITHKTQAPVTPHENLFKLSKSLKISRCELIWTPVWHCPSLCPSVCGMHSLSLAPVPHVHLFILNSLRRSLFEVTDGVKFAPRRSFMTSWQTQNADFTPCCIRSETLRAPEGLRCIFRNGGFQNQTQAKAHSSSNLE